MLGGGNEVGASCMHVMLNGVRMLVDAGTRPNAFDNMPSLGRLEDLGGVDLVLITHAHADHIGALPYLVRMYPTVPLYASRATIDLMQVMIPDAFRIMEETCKTEKRLMPYTAEDMQHCLDSMREFPHPSLLFKNVEITAYTAGHILGAVMYGISSTTGEERLLVTGDFSAHPSRALPSMEVPYDLEPNVVVMESTYGNKVHMDRLEEERQFINEIGQILERGGKVLLPSFALGRSQEIILILKHYMKTKRLPTFPIYVDGLVRDVCDVYSMHKDDLHPSLLRIQSDDLFFDNICHKVRNESDRRNILAGGPCCIVSSSGMLTGGPSVQYAKEICGNQNDAIFVIGYQDDESPGRKLLGLMNGASRVLSIDNQRYQVRCTVKGFGLSAHADRMAMSGLIRSTAPKHVLLVHGDENAQKDLKTKLRTTTICSQNNETYSFAPDWKIRRQLSFNTSNWVDKVIVYKKYSRHKLEIDSYNTNPRDFVIAHCTGYDKQNKQVFCSPLFPGSSTNILVKDIWYSLGEWSGTVQELREAYAEHIKKESTNKWDWFHVGTGRKETINTVASKMGRTSILDRILIGDYLTLLPPQYKYDYDDQQYYILNTDTLSHLSKLNASIVENKINELKENRTKTLDIVEKWSTSHNIPACGCTLKDDGIHLSFVSPQMADFFKDDIEWLVTSTGHPVHVMDRYASHKIWEIVKRVLPQLSSDKIRVEPKENTVTVYPPVPFEQDDVDLYKSVVFELTGLQLEVT